MKKIAFFLSIAFSLGLSAQKKDIDVEIMQYVKNVNKDSLKANVEKLVSFGTRHTMSSTTDQHKGIGASRNWVLSKFRTYAKIRTVEWRFFCKMKICNLMESELIKSQILAMRSHF